MTEQIKINRKRGRLLSAILLVVILLAAAGAASAYYMFVQKPLQARLTAESDMLFRLSGLQNPVNNRLDPKYTDTNGDLVADAATDPKELQDPATLYFSYVVTEDPSEYKKSFADLMAHISKATGKPVQYLESASTNDQLKALRDGQLQITALNTGNVPMGVCVAGFVPVAGLGDASGNNKYQMEILVAANSPINSVNDLRGHELTLTDPGSNSGYKAPLVLLQSLYGLSPGRDFGVRYSGGHEQSIRGLADGTFQAVAVANDVLKREVSDGVIKPAQFRSIFKSENFPTAAFGYAYNLKPALAEQIKKAILDFDWKGTGLEKQFASSDQTRFVPVDYKNDWALIRSIDDKIGFAYQIK